MPPRPIIIDCDPGQDDALAILLALASPEELEVLAVTAVAGNVPLALTEKNARKIVELAGRCRHPGARRLRSGAATRPGLRHACPRPDRPRWRRAARARRRRSPTAHAVDVIIDTLRAQPGAVTLCPIGPLTNIASAIQRAPDIVAHIDQIVLMGGAIGEGNVTPAAEFNIFADPHAAAIVFESGARLIMLGLDVTHQVLATPERVRAIAEPDTAVSRAVVGLLEFYNIFDQTRRNRPGAPMHDPCVIAYLLRPELFAGRDCHVAIETAGEHTLGRTVVDWSGRGSRHGQCDRHPPGRCGGLFCAADRAAGAALDFAAAGSGASHWPRAQGPRRSPPGHRRSRIMRGRDDEAELAIGLELLLVEELVGGRLIGKRGIGAAIAEQRQRQILDQGGLQVDQGRRLLVGVADRADDISLFPRA